MSNTAPPNLGVVIANDRARKAIYASYVIALVVAGALQAWFLEPDPQWLSQSVAVLTYLGIPVGTLAFANAPKPAVDGEGEGLFK